MDLVNSAPCGLRGCTNRPAPFLLAGCHKRRLNQALSVLSLSLGFFWLLLLLTMMYVLCCCLGTFFYRLCYSYVIGVFCHLVVLVRLSVPVQVIDWKDSSPKWHNMLMGSLNPTHPSPVNYTEHTEKKPMLRDGTDRAWFSRFLQYPTKKQSGSILSTWSPKSAWVPEVDRESSKESSDNAYIFFVWSGMTYRGCLGKGPLNKFFVVCYIEQQSKES